MDYLVQKFKIPVFRFVFSFRARDLLFPPGPLNFRRMDDFFSKLENFFFDILGLILPGAIFLLILVSPVLLVDMGKMEKAADTSAILSGLVTIWNVLKTYWVSHPRSALVIVAILAYLIGHTVKVFSRIKYEFLTAFFDNGINKVVISFYNKCKKWVFGSKTPPSWLKKLYAPFKNLFTGVFAFEPAYYSPKDEVIRQNCLDQVDTRVGIKLSQDKHTIVKISSVISNQENLRSLGTFFLAKYNLYRSLALIFLFTTFYYLYFFKVAKTFLLETTQGISSIMIVASVFLWYTFHAKYKRYWSLYGEERLITLFYFLNKKKIKQEEEIDERG